MTFTELSDRLEALGRPIPVLGLRRIERGERRVDVDDLFALALVLGVSPLTLLLPWPESPGAEVDCGEQLGAYTARQLWNWVQGREPLILSDADPAGDVRRFPIDALPPWARPGAQGRRLANGLAVRATDDQWEKLEAAGYMRGPLLRVGGGMAELLEDAPQQIANARKLAELPTTTAERRASLEQFAADLERELADLQEAHKRGEEQ